MCLCVCCGVDVDVDVFVKVDVSVDVRVEVDLCVCVCVCVDMDMDMSVLYSIYYSISLLYSTILLHLTSFHSSPIYSPLELILILILMGTLRSTV